MIVLELGPPPAHPVSLNASKGLHWAVQRRMVEPWQQLAWATARNAHLAETLKETPCTVTVHIPFVSNHRRDPHNYVLICKAVVDGLVAAGCWPDDDPRYVTVTEPVLIVDRTMRTPAAVHLTPREG